MSADCLDTDVLVIGAGIAGLRAALESARAGARTAILSKGIPARTSASYIAGGVAVALPTSNPQDGPDAHFRDTILGGAFLNDQRLVRIMVEEGQERFLELERLGARFDRTPDGRVVQIRRGGHSFGRLCVHRGDAGGQEMVLTLLRAVRAMGVAICSDFLATKLLVHDGVVAGTVGVDLKRGAPRSVQAGATLLATGGAARVYPVSSMPVELSGDGYSLAFRAGATLVDMEMVQFHPGGLYLPGTLMGVSTREPAFFAGLGGRLVNAAGERFMERYDRRLEMATRDIVARAEYIEAQQGRGGPNGGVFLDLAGIPREVRAQLPKTSSRFFDSCMTAGIDPREVDLIEIGPTVHYFMGGVRIDEHGASSLPGLYACGEVAGGIHGANRLSGNSLEDTLVFGARAGAAAARAAKDRGGAAPSSLAESEERELQSELYWREANGGVRPLEVERRIQEIMWQQVGVVRNEGGLRAAVEALSSLRQKATALPPGIGPHRRYNLNWLSAFEARGLLDTAEMIARSALARKESRGAHCRSDWPAQDDRNWLAHVAIARTGDQIEVWSEPVDLEAMDPRKGLGGDDRANVAYQHNSVRS